MPGVAEVLEALAEKGKKRAVVTNSPKEQIDVIKEKLPLLKTIPLWITREDYREAKPAPDGYLKAMGELMIPGDRVIGFEDTIKGLQALLAAGVTGVLVSSNKTHSAIAQKMGAVSSSSLSILHFKEKESMGRCGPTCL
jgi:HAD superfamily hydrolase (TIGR01509 family)